MCPPPGAFPKRNTPVRKGGNHMRIEAYSQVQNLYQTQKVKQPVKVNSTAKATDQVQISSAGTALTTAKAALANTSDIREDVTAPIKEKIQNGTYNVSVDSFAEKLLQKYAEMR